MPIYTHEYIKDQALELLEEWGVEDPPVDIRNIAKHLKLTIVEVLGEDWFYGMLLKFHGDFHIIINKMMPETKKRLTIAHEIGHFILHTDQMDFGENNEKQHLHREADVFATELCLPGFLIEREAGKWLGDHRFLAKMFEVSEGEMAKRLEQLRLAPQGKFSWLDTGCKSI